MKTNGVHLPRLVDLPEGPGYPLEGGDMRTIAWYREQWARERWKHFCAVWGMIGWAVWCEHVETAYARLEDMYIELQVWEGG